MNENQPYFSVVVPLYNKQSHVRETIETILSQRYQDFEIVVVNDGSKDDSLKIVESIKDSRLRIINQENQGVSVARNNGIKASKAEYIVFLDADDIWLLDFLENIYKMTIQFPEAGMYATKYNLVDKNGEQKEISVKGLPSKSENYIGIIPNYFKSAAVGDLPVWSSAVCIPKRIFTSNNIWFPVGEKYGEDQHVWARVAMKYEVAYNTKTCALYMLETENNTYLKNSKEKEPQESILGLRKFRESIKEEEKKKYFDKYIQRYISSQVLSNMKNGNKIYAIKQLFRYKLYFKYKIKFVILFIIPNQFYTYLKKYKNIIK